MRMSLNSDDNYPAVNESDNIEACDDEVEDESSENDFFWVLLKNGFDDKPTMMRRFALLGIFNFYDLSTTSEERLQEVFLMSFYSLLTYTFVAHILINCFMARLASQRSTHANFKRLPDAIPRRGLALR